MKALIGAVLMTVVCVVAAAPVHADDAKFLRLLDDKYPFLSSQQLLAEGYKVCAGFNRGMISPQAVDMVQKDLGGVSVPVGLDVVAAARVGLGC